MRIYLSLLILFFGIVGQASAQRNCLTIPGHVNSAVPARSFDNDSLVIIPLVVHLIYRDSSQMVTTEDILWQINQTNLDYQRLNDDRNLTPGLFADEAVDTRIGFCLAERDPAGQATMGITRTQTMLDEIGFSDAYYQTFLGGRDGWDPSSYLNIWVCEISEQGDVAGFATFPDEQIKARDGVVIDYRYFGRGPQAIPPFDAGRTLTHEIGHWLGLEHLWGTEPGCDTDDGIVDTPNQFDRYSGCPDFPQISCGTEDMFMNYMDLTDDRCMNLFTRGQKERMRGVLFTQRSSIINSGGCQEQTTGVRNINDFRLIVFPNPTRDELIIRGLRILDPIHYMIYDVDGREIKSFFAGNRLDLSSLKPGIYIISFYYRNQLNTLRFVRV